jgi:hypothetical protein
MARTLLPDGKVDRTGLRRWFEAHYGYRPGWYTITEAIRQGLPCEPHPLLGGKPIFDLAAVEVWVEARRRAAVTLDPQRDGLI